MGITVRTRLLGLLGYPVGHSWSPAMQNAALAAAGLDYAYLPLAVPPQGLGDAVRGLRALGAAGFNVTIPHKESVIPLLDQLEPAAGAVGAVNTVVNREGRLEGYNTDGSGFLRALRGAGFRTAGCHAVLIGAGGAARAVAAALALHGAKRVSVLNRSPERAAEVARLAGGLAAGCRIDALPLAGEEAAQVLAAAHLVVQATPLGMHPAVGGPLPVEPELLPAGALVCDLVYNPPRTAFLRAAEQRGCQTLDGLGMLAGQGEEAFLLWTGCQPPAGVMPETLRRLAQEAGVGKA